MQKLLKKITNENIIVFFVIIIAVTTFSFNIELIDGDELWNFSNVYKMTNGEVIYKDINVIITPLFFYIGKILFLIFGSNFFTFRIYNVIIYTMLFFLIYKLFEKLEIQRKNKLIYLIIIYFMTYGTISIGANYNILAINLCLIGILLLISKKSDLWQGLIIFLIFMTKQNIGIYYAIGYAIYNIWDKKNIIKAIKKMIPTYIIVIVLIAIYIIYLLINQNLYTFVDYTFLGINEFGTQNLKYEITSLLIVIIAAILHPVMIWITTSQKFHIEKNVRNKAKILISISIVNLLISYPLINSYHVNLSIILSIITFIYIFEKGFLEELTKGKVIERILNIINIFSIIVIICLCIYKNTKYLMQPKIHDNYSMYNGAVISEDKKNSIEIITKYMEKCYQEGYEVKILSYRANLYMNVLNKNNGKMDLPFYGNLGAKGENGLIDDISKLKNTKMLIYKEKDDVFQESQKVREYIMENYEKVDEIDDFFVYKIGY